MKEIILSVGIDIGTSTTQLIFSRLTIENRASGYTVPRFDIVDKEVIYRSAIYFTPLISNTEIDAEQVKRIVIEEYGKAGLSPKDVRTGAVIITGETARKQNASQTLAALSSLAGDFVVATAGPDLESVLSARGAGADCLSEQERKTVANLDVGGGTTNIAVFEKGHLKGTSCLDIGGRLIKVDDRKVRYVYPKIQALAKTGGIAIEAGSAVDVNKLRRICDLMASQLAQAVGLEKPDGFHNNLYTNDGKGLSRELEIDAVTFSGGVADLIENSEPGDSFRYGDIGVLLGKAIGAYPAFANAKRYRAAETIRATVVGAGTHTTEVSGSTISYSPGRLPIKNIPVLKASEEDEASLHTLASFISSQLPLYMPDNRPEQVAIALSGKKYTRFHDILALAEVIMECMREVIERGLLLIVVVEADIAKALGNALQFMLGEGREVICIDGVRPRNGDYIDIGEPIAGGHVVPVVIKTLIFNT